MRASTKFLIFLLAAVATFILVRHGNRALHASTPLDMPVDANFVQTGYDVQHNDATGHWIACRADQADNSDFCRVTDAHGIVLYQGSFSPLDSPAPLPDDQLHVAGGAVRKLWVRGPVEAAPVPVIPLTNGQLLVPTLDRDALRDRWALDPTERREIQGL